MNISSHILAILVKNKLFVVIAATLAIIVSVVFSHSAQALPAYAITQESCANIGGTYSASYQGSELVPTCAPPSANSAAYFKMSPTEKVYSLIYYRVISDCMLSGISANTAGSNLLRYSITRSAAQGGSWVNVGKDTYLGPYMRGMYNGSWNGKINCNDIDQLIKDAKDIWNIEYDAWFCAAGWVTAGVFDSDGIPASRSTTIQHYYGTFASVKEGSRLCTNEALNSSSVDTTLVYPIYYSSTSTVPRSDGPTTSTGYSTNPDEGGGKAQNNYTIARNMADVIKQKIFGNTEPEFTPAMKYAFARDTFFNSCGYGSTIEDGKDTAPGAQTDRDVQLHIISSVGSGENMVISDDYLWYKYGGNYSANGVIDGEGPKGAITTRVGIWNSGLNQGGLGTVTQTCQDLVNWINDQANRDAYSGALAVFGEDTRDETLGGGGETGTSCNIPGLGWLICPALSLGADLADGFYEYLAGSFLATDPSLVNTDPNATVDGKRVGTGTYTAWGIMRNIANVAFVIAILIIIFSQMTSVGISSYGVKKLLPRIIVAAVLVNLSFIICQIAVDVSNILGYTLKDALEGVAQQVKSQSGGTGVSTTNEATNLGGILLTIIAVAAVSWVNIGAVIVAIVGALISLFTIFVILVVRKVLIVLLIVVAPLAFVAYLLPNTEQYFQKWRKAMTALLLLFPIVGLLYGGSILASTVLLQVAGDDTLMRIAAYMALVIPLIAVVPLLRSSLSAFGSIGSAIQNAGNRFGGLAKNKTQKTYDNSRLGQFKQYRQGQWDRGRAKLQSGGRFAGGMKNPLNWGSAVNRGANRISGKFGDKLSAQGDYLINKEDQELMDASSAKVDNMKNGMGIPLSTKEMFDLLEGTDVGNIKAKQLGNHDRRALAKTIAGRADAIELNDLVNIAAKEEDAIVRNSMTDSIYSSPARAKMPWLGSTTRGDLIQGPSAGGKFSKANMDKHPKNTTASMLSMQEGASKGKMTAQALATGDDKSVNELVDAVTAMAPGSERDKALARLEKAYDDFSSPEFDSKLKADIVEGGDHYQAIERIAGLLGRTGGGGSPSGGSSGGGNPPPLF